MKQPKKNLLAVCHDAGGAEIVSAFLKKNLAKFRVSCFVMGPAAAIFKRKGLGRHLVSAQRAARLALSVDLALTGTSWGSQIELDFIRAAKRSGVRTASYLDHWTNYRERFGYPRKNWQKNLPDEIWAGDTHALALAKKHFKECACTLEPNAYFEEIKTAYRNKKKKKEHAIVFIDEPLRAAGELFAIKSSFTEHDVLKILLGHLAEENADDMVIIRYHPASSPKKYALLLSAYRKKLRFGPSKKNLLDDIMRARTVVGMRSMGLVAAALCGKKTIGFLPGKEQSPLPMKEIIKVRSIKELHSALC